MTDFTTYLHRFIENAVKEDIGDGDHTTLSCIPETAQGKANLIAKQEGIIAGSDIARRIFYFFDKHILFEQLINDGESIKPGDIVFTVDGKTHAILQAERLALNVMQRMSGIATQTRRYVEKLDGLKTKVLDTRKTTPGMRWLEKIAVKTGGGVNHRMGLFDMIMLKDNHIDFAGGIEKAIKAVNVYLKRENKTLPIVIEARSLNDVKTILGYGGVDRIMLDNFTVKQTREAVKIINGRFETESSGGITLDTIRGYAECGVDYISVGALTHQVKSLDLSLKAG